MPKRNVKSIKFSPRKLLRASLEFLRESLIKNASFLVSAEITNSLFGFLFWSIAAKMYPPDDIGKVSVMLSVAALVSLFSGFGFGDGLVRMLPDSEEQERLVSSVILFIAITSVVVTGLFLQFQLFGVNELGFLHEKPVTLFLFWGYCVLNSIFSILRMIFLARKSTKYVFFQSLIFNILRVVLIFVFLWLNFLGLFSANLVGILASVAIGLIVFMPLAMSRSLKLDFNLSDITSIFPYSVGNYLSSLTGQLPRRVVPLLALFLLGADSAGYGQIAWMIASFITVPAMSIASSAFSEASNDPGHSKGYFFKALCTGLVITVTISVGFYIIAPWILAFIGKGYVIEGTGLLRWLAIAAPLMVVDGLYFVILRFQKRLRLLNAMSGLLAVTIIGSAYYFMPKYGLSGYGISWTIGHLIVFVFSLMDRGIRNNLKVIAV